MLYRRNDTGAMARHIATASDYHNGPTAIIRSVINGALHVMPVERFKENFQRVDSDGFDIVADVMEFHHRFNQLYEGKPRGLTDDDQQFRNKFMDEELDEYKAAIDRLSLAMSLADDAEVQKALADALDALVDLVYVAVGTAVGFHGFNFRKAWMRVHDANMRKVAVPDDKRIGKPEGWQAPSHIDLVADHAHKCPSNLTEAFERSRNAATMQRSLMSCD